ncbi:DUF262 domain-containing protein [Chloroflexota bacterium]
MNIFSSGESLGSIRVHELVKAMDDKQRKIQLTAFQRDAVWDEDRTEVLWDSIIKKFPIGSFLFARVKRQVLSQLWVRHPQMDRYQPPGDVHTSVEGIEYIIIDGHQRSISITLGLRIWQPEDQARLWFELGCLKEDGLSNRFFVCTLSIPWGKEATPTMQREALKKLGIEELELDNDTLGITYPVRANLPVPFAELLVLLNDGGQANWMELVPEAKRSSTPYPDLQEIFSEVSKVPDNEIPVLLVKDLEPGELGEIFHRLNKQGLPMSAEDLFFSSLKLEWPNAHNLVWNIYKDEKTGRVLPPTKIVHLAVRLALASDGERMDKLNTEGFKRFIHSEDKTGQDYLSKVQLLLSSEDTNEGGKSGQMLQSLRLARHALLYQPSSQLGTIDPGLPVTLLASIHPRVWHTLVAWIIQHNNQPDAESRLEMIRYALLDYFFIKSSKTFLTWKPFELAYLTNGIFPGKTIYEVLQQNRLLIREDLSPEAFETELRNSDPPRWSILRNEHILVLWGQRYYIHQWFPDFDPSLYQKKTDLPYDADHIIPRAHLDERSQPRGKNYQASQEFRDNKKRILNSPGNIRFWPKHLNRSDGQKNLDKKFLIGAADEGTPQGSYLQRFKMDNVGEVQNASLFSEGQLDYWKQASNLDGDGNPHDWRDKERMLAFRDATYFRRIEIYQNFFEQVGMNAWLNTSA